MRAKSLSLAACVFGIAVIALAPAALAGPYVGWDLRMVDVTGNPNQLQDSVPLGDSPAGGPYPGGYTVTFDGKMHYSTPDWGNGGNYGLNLNYPSGTNSTDSFTLKASADITIPAGTWTVGWGSDDGGMIRINDASINFTTRYGTYYDAGWPAEPGTNTVSSNQWRGHTWTGGTFTIAAPLTTTMDVYMFEGGGGDSLEIGMNTGTVTGVLPLLTDGTLGWSITGSETPRQFASYQIRVGSAGSATINEARRSDVQTALGATRFQGTVSGNPTATGTGSVPLAVSPNIDYIQIDASGIQNWPVAPWMAATFTAPLNYIFTQTGNQYLTTQSSGAPGWRDSLGQWGQVGGGLGDAIMYQVTSPNPGMGGGFAPGTQAIWGQDGEGNTQTRAFFDVPASLTPGSWTIFTPPEQVAQPPGLSSHIVRVNSNLDNLGQVDTALNLRRGNADHSVSGTAVLAAGNVDSSNAYGTTRYLPGDHYSGGANPEDYAMRISAYVQVPSDNYTATFAVSGDNRFYFRVAGTEFMRSEGVIGATTPILASMTFPTQGYYPIELVWANRDGGGGTEVSYAAGFQTTWSQTGFSLLGTGALGVFQRPAGLGDMTNVGANTVGGGVYSGTVTPAADGFRVQQGPTGSASGNISEAISYFSNKAILNYNQGNATTGYNIGAVYTTPNMNIDLAAGTGNWGSSQPFPDPTNTANFATRINGLVYIPAAGAYSMSVGTDDGYWLRVGNQNLGSLAGGRGIPGGTANMSYGYFPQAGLYPLEFYSFQGGSGAGIEIGYKYLGPNATDTALIMTGRNPATQGYSVDWTGVAYNVVPTAELKANLTQIQGKAFGLVPALGNMTVPPESWKLYKQRKTDSPGPGLMGVKYNRSTGDPWNDAWPVIATEMFFTPPSPYTTFNIPDGRGYGFQTNLQGDNIGARWTGYLNIPAAGAGLWNFRQDTDDISWIFVDIDGDYDIPGPGYHVFEAGEAAPGNQNWTVIWNGVNLSAGNHWVEFRSVEGGGGEWTNVQWQGPAGSGYETMGSIPGSALYWIWPAGTWELIASGAFDDVGNLLGFEDMYPFAYDSSETLRLQVDIAGLTATYEGTFLFVPEPGTMLLLAGGLLAVAARRRRSRTK